jgi:hypothetical protein
LENVHEVSVQGTGALSTKKPPPLFPARFHKNEQSVTVAEERRQWRPPPDDEVVTLLMKSQLATVIWPSRM